MAGLEEGLVMLGLALAVLLGTGELVWPPHSPSLPVTGPGPMLNLGGGDAAVANASAHAAWSVMVPVVAERIGGRDAMWWAVAGNAALTVVHESCFHNGSGPEVRTDLVTRIGPSLLTAGIYEGLHRLGWLRW